MKAPSVYALFFRFAGWVVCLALLCQPGAENRAASLADVIIVTGTIQEAIDAAQDGDTISIPAGLWIETLTADKSLTLVSLPGAGGTMATLWPSGNNRIITVTAGHNLTLQDLNLSSGYNGGAGSNEGGAVLIQNGTLTIDHCYIYSNKGNYGGAVRQTGTGGVVVQNDTYIYNNEASVDGGAIMADGSLSLTDFALYSNQAGRHGGAAAVLGAQLRALRGTVTGNQAGQNGGAFNVNNSLSVAQVDFAGNTAGTNGGAILQWNGNSSYSVDIQDSTFDDNQAGETGGALSVFQGAVTTIGASHFEANVVDTATMVDPKGGAVYFADASWGHTLTITNTTFLSNFLDCFMCGYPSGGGLYARTFSPGKVILDGDTFIANDGWIGGGVNADRATIQRTTFQGNTGGDGAGAYLSGASQIMNSAFYQNSVTNGGGGLFVPISPASLTLEDTKFIGNSGGNDLGGAMNLNAQNITLKNVAVADTQVTSGSAVMFSNPSSTIELYHVTVNDTHKQDGTRSGTYGIHINGPTIVNIWNSMITNHGTGVKIATGSACSLDHTLWYGNALDIAGDPFTYADNYPVASDPAYAVDRYHLTSASGAINQGVDRMVYHDLDGETRLGLPDIGADEFLAWLYLPLITQ